MNIDLSNFARRVVAHVRESRIDAACAIEFKDRMREVIETHDRPIVLDLAEVDFIDSSGLGAIVALRKMLGPDRPLELARLSSAVAKVFRLTRLDDVFLIHADLDGLMDHAG